MRQNVSPGEVKICGPESLVPVSPRGGGGLCGTAAVQYHVAEMFCGDGCRVSAGALSLVVVVRVEDGSSSLNILQRFGFCEL